MPAPELNRDAGDYLVASDPDALRACEGAAEICTAQYPYLVSRFGERGRRFAVSDGAWLVVAASEGTDLALRRVLWLGRILAVRGIPRIVLEKHLALLADGLALWRHGASPELSDRATPTHSALRVASEMLRGRRERAFAPGDFERLAARFEDAAPVVEHALLPRCGELIASAVADERDGLSAAVPSLMVWLGDPERFSRDWVDEAEDAVGRARRASRDVASRSC